MCFYLTDFRKDINIEKERETIREPILSKKRKKIIPPEITTEKRPKKPQTITSGTTTNTVTAPPPPLPREKATKHCPVCNKPFTDITEFMSHLNNCNLDASDGEDDILNGADLFDSGDSGDFKPILDENGLAMPSSTSTSTFKPG